MGEIAEPISPELVLVDSELAAAIRLRSPSTPFRVVFVCTGNRFRSALAAAAFRFAAAQLPVEVDSYGTLDISLAQPLPEALVIAAAYGLDLSGHLSKSLDTTDLSQASLVVGFEPQHTRAAVEIAGARPECSFLLRELNDLLEADFRPTFGPPRAGDVDHSLASIDRAKRLIGYAPWMSVREGLAATVPWYAARPPTVGVGAGARGGVVE